MVIKAIIWDLGGVLVRTEDYSPRQVLADNHGLSLAELEELVFNSQTAINAQLGKIDADEHWNNVAAAMNLPTGAAAHLQKLFWGGDRLDNQLISEIMALQNEYRTALLSNAFSDLRRMLIEEWQIDDSFDEIVISAEVNLMKPDARIFERVLRLLNVMPEEAVFIDDFQSNIAGAQALNLRTIHFKSSDQTLSDLHFILGRQL